MPPATIPEKDLCRTKADEEADHQQTLSNFTSQVFEDWPNEAGFDGLTEKRGPIEIPVTGTIPVWAAGIVYRTGPSQLRVEGTPKGTHNVSHWFDGLAHTHRFEIVPVKSVDGGNSKENDSKARVFYSSRRQSDKLVEYLQAQGPNELFSFGQRRDPCMGLLGKFMSTFRNAALRPPDVLASEARNVNVVMLPNAPFKEAASSSAALSTTVTAGHKATPRNLWITTDTNYMRQVDPTTLESIRMDQQNSLHPDLRGPLSAAHGQRDPKTGDLYNFNLELGISPVYRIFRVSMESGSTEILATIPCGGSGPRPAYIHSFFLTAHYVVLCVPSTHLALSGLKTLWEHNLADGMVPFNACNKMRWFVVDRTPDRSRGGGVVAKLESEAGFFFHSINAYEEEETNGEQSIVCDFVDYATYDIIHAFYYDVMINQNGAGAAFYKDPTRAANSVPRLSRYRLRLPSRASGRSKGETAVIPAELLLRIPGPHAGELPSINPAYATRRHRYVYSICNRGRATLADALCKTDTLMRKTYVWSGPHGHAPGEPLFVLRPSQDGDNKSREADEDDGVLLSVVLDGENRRSYLLCLDAHTMQELGRADMEFAVGLGFHGVHLQGQ